MIIIMEIIIIKRINAGIWRLNLWIWQFEKLIKDLILNKWINKQVSKLDDNYNGNNNN